MLGRDPAGQQTLPALSLDHGRVLSQWENMGGKVEFDTDAALQEALANPLDPSDRFVSGNAGRCSILQGGLDGSTQPSLWLDLGAPLSAETLPPQACLAGEHGCTDANSSLDGLVGEWQLSGNSQLQFDDFEWVAAEAGQVAVAGDQTSNCWLGEMVMDGVGQHDQLVDSKQQTVKVSLATPSFNVVSSCALTATAPPRAHTAKVEVGAGNNHLAPAPVPRPLPSAARTGSVTSESPATFVVPFSGGVANMQGINCLKDGRTRTQCLQRYREKKARRLYTKKIRYELRKINADRRPRIKGRFVKKEELQAYLRLQEMPKEKLGEHASMHSNDLENSAKGEDTPISI